MGRWLYGCGCGEFVGVTCRCNGSCLESNKVHHLKAPMGSDSAWAHAQQAARASAQQAPAEHMGLARACTMQVALS